MDMEAYYSGSYSSSSNSTYSSQNPREHPRRRINMELPSYPNFQSHINSFLHSVRKPQSKPWKKAPVAPAMPPRPVKVYKVDPINFRELVQHLTGAARVVPDQLKPPSSVARAATNSPDVAASYPPPDWFQSEEAFGVKPHEANIDHHDGVVVTAPFSDSSYYSSWCCSFPPLSPGTMTSLELDSVL